MKIKAAVLREPNKPITIEELELAPPKENEILVKMAYTGFCHSDLHLILGEIPIALPMVLGHEASGVVEEVGPGVTHLKKGDHVVCSWMVPCGKCHNCHRGKGYICTGSFEFFLEGKLLDGTSRLTDKDGKEVLHQNYVSGFSDHMVVPADGAFKINKDFPLDQACFMGCCVPTGWGAVTNVGEVQPGDSVAIWGLGGVGLNILRACALRHANPIIAVDLEAGKETLAKEFGATHFICNKDEDPIPKIQEITGGGADVVFEAIGDSGAIEQAYWATGIGAKLVIAGVTPAEETANLQLFLLPLHQKSILGTLYGNISTHIDIPRLVEMAMNHDLKLDQLITKYFKVEEINEVAEAMVKRQIKGRWVCKWD
jgi:Zn-dependent alcohol dehydrogenase